MDRNIESRDCMNLTISCTTGTRLELPVPLEETVDGLKRRLSQKLRVHRDRLMLLLRDTRLSSGKLQDLGVCDGSRLTLVPTVETGLMSQSWRPEQSVLQALEGLTDAQVGDFLSGRSPLTLALRVGDHMMFVQLQLSAHQTVPSVSRSPSGTNQIPKETGGDESFRRSSSPHLLKTHPTPSSPPGGAVPRTRHTQNVHSPTLATPCLQPDGGVQNSRQQHKPGAFIESLVNHAPGVFSGTFSGTLHPSCQDGSGRPRRDITTILQILNDLLSATRHYQGSPPTLAHLRCRTPISPTSPCSPTSTSEEQKNVPLRRPSVERSRQTENKATRCKVEHLQLLLQQRRLRRKARRDPRGPYRWPADRKAPRRHSNSSLSSDGSLDLDFEETVWKPEVQSDMNAEFVVA